MPGVVETSGSPRTHQTGYNPRQQPCSNGMAEYFGVPPVVVRAAFVIATFLSILGLVPYFILAVWMPKPHATD